MSDLTDYDHVNNQYFEMFSQWWTSASSYGPWVFCMGSGQFGTGQFGPGQSDTRTIRSRTIRYQNNYVLGQIGPGKFGTEMTMIKKEIGKI